ncbi:hypothetical protein [Myxococcus virescens]|uniref:Uncharacterized protein n=1 Tax=Myxococcus virescens TaxID=83456 RepID=A0ABY0MU53_9BACT|nr:hypothetical protein [Myxococcus virescens]SDE53206.1 hypothetical protein SAMN04488504_10883 [Myxococcus virescens]
MSRTCWVATGCSVITFETAGGGVVDPEPNQPILIGTAEGERKFKVRFS